MAQDMYAPKSAFNIGYEQPLQAVEDRTEQISTDFQRMALRSEAKAINTEATVQRADFARKEAMLNIFSSGLSAFDSVLTANKAKRQDNLDKNFLSELDSIEQARESGDVSTMKIQAREGDLVRSALVSGVDFDKIKTEIELITDRPITMLGKSPEQFANSQMRNDPKYMIYTNASRLLNEGFSEQQHEEFAFDQIQMQQKNLAISDMAASRRKADEAITFNQFRTEDQPVIDDRFDTLVSSFIAGAERSSGIINREQVRSIKQAIQAEYTNLLSYKAVSGINSDDFQPFLDRVKGLEDSVDTILASTKSDVYWEDFKAVIAANAKNGGDPADMLAAMATGDIPTLAQTMGAGNLSERLNDLVNSDAVKKYYEPISSGQTLTDLQSNSDGIVNPNSVFDIDNLPEEFVQESTTPGDRTGVSDKKKTKANYNTGILYVQNVDINKLQEENFQKQFITGAINVGRSLSTSDVAGSKDRISEAIVSTDMLNKLNRLESYNKTAADTIRIGVRSQLSHQRVVNSKYLDNIENGAGRLFGYTITMTWDEGEKVYYINPADKPDQDKKKGIVRHIETLDPPYVKANYVEGKGLRADPQQSRYFRGGVIEKALNARSSIEFIDKQFKLFEKEGIEVTETVQPSIEEITNTALDQVDTSPEIPTAEELKESSIRSIRNNNPGNIKKTNTQWEGMTEEQVDSTFVSFDSPKMGVRALARVLNTYNTKYNLDDISGMVSRFAPPTENDTQNYIKFVSDKSGISRTKKITLQENPEDMKKVITAMIEMEGGSDSIKYFTPSVINEGVKLALESTASQDVGIDEDPQQVTIERIPMRPDDETLGAAWDILYGDSMKPENKPLRESKRPQQRP